MASYDTGYEDELFQYPVGPSPHCCICTNVIKDPVMCHNEHIFCRACITRHLMNSQTCPTCMQPLTVDTLRQATRGIRNLLAELKIRCEFFDRGCGKFIELGDLERHVADCGFAPAVCSNEGCQLEVNKQDLLHHETSVCELRRVQCHSCNDIRRELDTVKVNLAAMNEKLDRNEKKFERIEENLKRNEKSVKAMVDNVIAKVQEEFRKQEKSNGQLKVDNVEMHKSLKKITKQLERMTQQTSHEAGNMKKGIAEAFEMDREPKIVIAGGQDEQSGRLNSVVMFCAATGTWTPLQPMNECRDGASSVVYNNQLIVSGGLDNDGKLSKTMERLSLNAVQVDQSITWERFPAQLPEALAHHCSIVYNGRLIVIGGYANGKYSASITEVSLVPPYTSKLLATMPQVRNHHGVAIFGDKILIFGGREGFFFETALRSVVMYDITKNKCQELAPLPYPMSEMATVKLGDDNVMLIGGLGSGCKVLVYNITTQKSHMLPDMKYWKVDCVAAAVRDTVIVMGGRHEEFCVNFVERFTFASYSWEELPRMQEARWGATAVVC